MLAEERNIESYENRRGRNPRFSAMWGASLYHAEYAIVLVFICFLSRGTNELSFATANLALHPPHPKRSKWVPFQGTSHKLVNAASQRWNTVTKVLEAIFVNRDAIKTMYA